MKIFRAFLIALALTAPSVAVRAQTPQPAPPPSKASEAQQFSALAGNALSKLSDVIAERDEARAQVVALQAQVAAVQKQLDEARAASAKPPQDAKP